MTKEFRVWMVALAAGCVCSMHGMSAAGGAQARPAELTGASPAEISVMGEVGPRVEAVDRLEERFAALAFGPAQVADALLQPVVIPPANVRGLEEEDARAFDNGPAPYRIGVKLVAPGGAITSEADGLWDVLADGTQTWTVRIEVPTALGTSLEFENLDLPAGSALLIRGEDGTVQAWEGRGPNSNGYLQTPIVTGPWAEVQYVAPAGVQGAPGIMISSVSHLYRLGSILPQGEEEAREGDERVDLACHEDVMCHTPDTIARDSVGAMFFSGGFVCSGGLLADQDPNTSKGWFLTANHCLSTQGAVNSLTVYWKYQKAGCAGATPNINLLPRSTGGTLVATSSQTDFTFIRLASDPYYPVHAAGSPTFAGWTTTVPSNGSAVQGIHHPNFEYKRYSEGNTTLSGQICGGLSTSFFYYGDWTLGATEGGSSGSPLFNSSWQVIGQLFGACYSATPGCNNPSQWNWVYGRFNQTYLQNAAVQTSLTTVEPDDGYEDNDAVGSPAALAFGSHNLILIDFDDYFEITVDCPTTLQVTATFQASQMDLDLYLYNQFNSLITSQVGSGSPKTIITAVNPGTYKIRTNKNSGWGGAYTLNVLISPDCTPSGVCCFGCDHAIVPGTCPDGANFVAAFCAEMEEADCLAIGGAYRGDNTTCIGLPNACQCGGDVNGDGLCNASDFTVMAGSFGQGTPSCMGRSSGDLNCDGVVNAADFTIMAGNFGCAGN